jgi:CubicO group peptidase (beta-lactamase class C family)
MSRTFVRRAVRTLVLASIVSSIGTDTAAENSSLGLSGVWRAERNFGPDVRGPLTITRRGEDWIASIAGRSTSAHLDDDRVSFVLADGEGSFRGAFAQKGATISGFWTQQRAVFIGNAFASPVTLKKAAAELWRGEVTPLDDTMTLYLVITAQQDGSFTTFLRNPERNVGLFLKTDRLERRGDELLLETSDPETGATQVVARGSYDATNAVISFYVPEAGGSFDFTRASPDSGFYPRGENPAPYVYHKPIQRDDGWQVSSLEAVGISRRAIENLLRTIIAARDDSIHAPAFHGILIARHGKLVLEEYFHGYSADEPHDTRSAAKTMAAVIAGAAIYAHMPISLSTPVYRTYFGEELPTNLDPRAQRITLKNLLTMSSGLDCNDWDNTTPGSEDNMQNQPQEPDWRHFTLNVPMAREPGSLSFYCAGGPNLIGGMLEKITGKTDQELFDTLVAKPLQFGPYHMNLDPSGNAYFGGGMHLLPRDFMKFAQLLLDGGIWHGKRILPREFAQQAIATQTHIDQRHPAQQPGYIARKYGYLIWVNDYPYKGRTIEAFFLAGNGGQIVMGVPTLDLAMAFYGGSYSDHAGTYLAQDHYVPDFILPAVAEGQ